MELLTVERNAMKRLIPRDALQIPAFSSVVMEFWKLVRNVITAISPKGHWMGIVTNDQILAEWIVSCSIVEMVLWIL